MKRPAKSKKSKKSAKSRKSGKAKRSVKSKGAARRKPAAKTKKSKKPAKAKTPTAAPPKVLGAAGPRLAANEQGVHLILVRDEAVACQSHADPTDHELKQVSSALARVPAPTDVVVFGGKPYQMGGGALRKHPRVHTDFPETVLTLHGRTGDSAVWWSEEPFTITSIVEDPLPGRPHSPGHGPYPFGEMPVTRPEAGGIYVARSTVAVPGSYGHQYKINFTMGGRDIDPHMDSEP